VTGVWWPLLCFKLRNPATQQTAKGLTSPRGFPVVSSLVPDLQYSQVDLIATRVRVETIVDVGRGNVDNK
jgi:hypothetical protein